ncbi:hypothetical protein [Brevibacterium oceani]|uniref:hypothetical protein n=1 Tax=Brevibacterium oceani TaxID=358099 RepID=UPI0015E7C5AD|nr:hypothetical protein [Brevibacterium oceani]
MNTYDNFSNDNDDVERSASNVNENVDSNSSADAVDQSESTNDGSNDAQGDPTAGDDETTIDSAADDVTDGTVLDETGDDTDGDEAGAGDSTARDDSDVDLPQLLRQVSRVMRREFRAAAKDSGFDPRDFGRMRRGRRDWDDEEMVADGAPGPEEPVSYGPPRGRRGWGPNGDVNPEELRRRMRDLRDNVGDKVEDVLSSEEFEDLKASLSKIVDAFGADRCGDDSRWGEHRRGGRGARGDHESRGGWDDRDDHPDHESGPRGHHHGDAEHDGPHGGPGRGGPGRGGPGHGDRRGGGRGRRGFGPGFGPGFGGGFGPGRRGFDPFGWAEDRRDRERDHDREVQDAFERGFAAGFEQGRNS